MKHMHKNLVELNKAINAGAVSENVIENERRRKEPPCQLPLHGAWTSQRGQSASVTRMQSPAGDSDLTTSSVYRERTIPINCVSH